MAAIPPRDVLNKETNARFWAQFHYKPGQKLSADNPTDRAMMPVWMNVFHQVEREAKAGKLVLTYDRPEVQQALADAEVADQAAAMHLDAASKAPDAATAQQNVTAATTATQVSAQKAREAAAVQPPSISPDVASTAATEAARTPPPPHAPPMEHIAHARTQPPPSPSRQPFSPREIFIQETNARFWAQTGYKLGQKLDMSDPEDRRMSKRWMSIFRQVQHEAATGRFTPSAPYAPIPSAPPPSAAPPPPSPVPPVPPEVPAGPPQVPAGPLVAPDTYVQPPSEEPKPFPIGKVLAIAAALAAAGGLAYMATRKPERAAPRPRARAPKVFVASPTRVFRATPARAVPRSPGRKLLPAGPSTSRSARG